MGGWYGRRGCKLAAASTRRSVGNVASLVALSLVLSGAPVAAAPPVAPKGPTSQVPAPKVPKVGAVPHGTPPVGRHFLAELVATSFFRGLVDGRLAAIAPLCARRVSFDGRWIEGRLAQERQLQQVIQRARRTGLKLRGVWVLTQDEMVARFGAAPARLQAALRPGDLIALARFDRLGAVAALRREGRFYRVHLLSD